MKPELQISNIINQNSIEEAWNYIDSSSKIVIIGHVSPDGDAIGSSLGLFHFLTHYGKKDIEVVVPNEFPQFLAWMKGSERILVHSKMQENTEKAIKEADLIFLLDFNALKRTSQLEPLIAESNAKKVMIDHHLHPEDVSDVTISHPPISSTSELIFRFIYQSGERGEINYDIAECIYCGMMTDTGSFTYNSEDPEIFEVISMLLKTGIHKDKIYSSVYHNFSEDRFRLLGFALLNRLRVFKENNAALIYLTLEDQRQFNLNKGDTEGFANYPLNIKKIKFAVFIREEAHMVKISLRSQGTFPCNKFASEFYNGGGHLNASGGEFYGKIEDAVKICEEGIQKYSELLRVDD